MATPNITWRANSSLPLHEIIRRALLGKNSLALGPSYITVPFVPERVARGYNVDGVCTVADIEAARSAIISAIPIFEQVVLSLDAAGNILDKDDIELTARELCEKYDTATGWGEHPDFTMDDWRDEVSNQATRLGYWDWLKARIAFVADDK